MSAITVNTFPSIHSFTSARSWFLAIIVLLHVGFFWALSNGLSIGSVIEFSPPIIADFVPAKPRPVPPEKIIKDPVPVIRDVYVPTTPEPRLDLKDEPRESIRGTTDLLPPPSDDFRAPPAAPIVIEPEIDARVGLSAPLYPPAAIRGNQTGTVTLSVLVLENGRIGDVRIDQSSGHARLDESAVREAHRWRLKPGMRDGVPVAMWKQIPVTFQLRDSVKF